MRENAPIQGSCNVHVILPETSQANFIVCTVNGHEQLKICIGCTAMQYILQICICLLPFFCITSHVIISNQYSIFVQQRQILPFFQVLMHSKISLCILWEIHEDVCQYYLLFDSSLILLLKNVGMFFQQGLPQARSTT